MIGFNHGLPSYVKTMALGPQSRQKHRPMASVFVYLNPSGHVFNKAWQAMIKTYNTGSGGIDIFKVNLTFDMLTVRRQQHSFSTHERVFLWKCKSFWDRKCLSLRIHAEMFSL